MTRAGLLTRLAFALEALIVVSLAAAALVLVRAAEAHRIEQSRHMVDLARWRVLERPEWSTLLDVAAVRDASGLPGYELPLYDRVRAGVVAAAIEGTPGVRRLVSLLRRAPDRVEAVLELRVPAAAVALPTGGYVEVDDEGVVLGAEQPSRPVRRGVALRVVTGAADVSATPGREVGDDVRAGVALCCSLDAYRDGLGATVLRLFDEVDVGNVGGRIDAREPEILLRAALPVSGASRRTGCVVEWGRPEMPDGAGPALGEPTFRQKAARLAEATRVFGDFDGIARVRVGFGELSVLPVDGPAGAWLPALAEQTQGR